MTVLIVHASIEGQTGKIADFVEAEVRKAGHEVARFDADEKTAPVFFDDVTKVILAAPVHERRHPETFEVFVSAHRADLQARPSLMLSVSLSAAFPEGMEEAQEYLTEMEMRTRFKATAEALVAGAVRTGSYDYFQSQVLRHVVLRDREYDAGGGPQEFTDWDALAAQVADFLQDAAGSDTAA